MMKFWVGVTDNDWFRYQEAHLFDEVNFWQPSATPPFAAPSPGMPFLFKLKSPHNHIAGGGFFTSYSTLPLSMAWDVFGRKNGADSLGALRQLIDPRRAADTRGRNIGCTVLTSPFFLKREDWIELPREAFAGNIVRGKFFDTAEGTGRSIMRHIHGRLSRLLASAPVQPEQITPPVPLGGFGTPQWVAPRLGQSSFRTLVTEAYSRRCAMTGENTLIALEAAHIVPYSEKAEHDVRNGLLLRADFHKLFDQGLVGVTPDLIMRISPVIAESWFNGKAYYRLDKQPLTVVPVREQDRPDRDRLDWHMTHVFQT